jgi:predicted protein tyrosine phosphatase
MPHIIVTSLARLPDTARLHNPRDMITLINSGTPVTRPDCIEPERHLFLGFNDIVEAQPGMTPPGEDHVIQLVSFARNWDRAAPLLIHCFAGISRSTAAAYIAAIAIEPDQQEEALARELRMRAPSATPNSRLIAIADDILGRNGRMVAAIGAIGRGEDAFEGTPFILPVRTSSAWSG